MKAVRLVSLIARVALIVTLGLGLLYWIAQLFAWIGLLVFLAQIGFPNIHEGFGTIGVLGLLILGTVAVFTKGSKLLGAGSMLYAFLVPAFGLTQTLILVGALRLYDPGRSLAGRDWSYGAGTKDRETLSAASQTERTGDDFRQRPGHVILCDTPATRNSRAVREHFSACSCMTCRFQIVEIRIVPTDQLREGFKRQRSLNPSLNSSACQRRLEINTIRDCLSHLFP